MKIKNFAYIIVACYAATILRILINSNFIVSIIGSLFVGFFIGKGLSHLSEESMLSGFFSCFTSVCGFIFFLHKILEQEEFIMFIFWFNFIIIVNIFTMYFGFWISRKIT